MNPYGFGQATPFSLDYLKTLAGIVNAERISKEIKDKAESAMEGIISLVNKELDEIRAENSGIELK